MAESDTEGPDGTTATLVASGGGGSTPSVEPRLSHRGGSSPPSWATSATGATAYAADVPALAASSADSGDPLVGKRIDHFEIRGRLGEGGMGTVYLAHDVSLERPVALKVLRRELGGNQELVERLIMEARAQARLQHPNVVTIYYIGVYEGAPYFAMEYVRGRSLDEHLTEKGAIPWQEALDHVIQTARALAAAYRRGIIHRDIKPSNLILSPVESGGVHGGQVVVADFGLAAPIGGREGSFAGSPHYASPEQIGARALDHRTDIYALGVTFYELVTGARPFDAGTLAELFVQHETAARPAVPEDKAPGRVRRLIAEMMDADPARRPAAYEELLARLESARPKHAAAGGLIARGMALAVDLTVLAIFGQIIAGLSPLSQVVANQFGMVLFGLYCVIAHKRWKRTLGKQLLGLRLQGTHRSLTWGSLTARFLVEFWGPIVATLMINLQLGAATDLEAVKERLTGVLGVDEIPIVDDSLQALLKTVLVPNLMLAVPWLGGFLFALFDDKRQALHDRAARTRVVYRHADR